MRIHNAALKWKIETGKLKIALLFFFFLPFSLLFQTTTLCRQFAASRFFNGCGVLTLRLTTFSFASLKKPAPAATELLYTHTHTHYFFRLPFF